MKACPSKTPEVALVVRNTSCNVLLVAAAVDRSTNRIELLAESAMNQLHMEMMVEKLRAKTLEHRLGSIFAMGYRQSACRCD